MTKKFETRGGYRKKKRLYSSQARFLEALWEQLGGVTVCAKKIGHDCSRQLLINWKLDGKVPLEWVGLVSRALIINPYALNYEGMIDTNSENSPIKWKALVEQYLESKEVADSVLAVTLPKTAKEILE